MQVRSAFERFAPEANRVVAAVSGGADSVALLRALVAAGFDVVVGHLDHALRDESTEDAAFVQTLAGELALPSRVARVEVRRVARERGLNLEEAGRRIRYEFLTRVARESGAQLVVTGHNLDDQAETVLMQLLRGAAHLRGMAPMSGRVLRPLLGVRHEELEQYLRELDQPWREDASNQDVRFLRAWLRNEVVPLLQSRFPRAKERLAHHGLVQQDVAEFVSRAAVALRRDDGFDRKELVRAHPAVQREALRQLFDEAGVAPDSGKIEELRTRLAEERPFRLSIAPEVVLRLAYGRVGVARRSGRPVEREVTAASQLPEGVPASVLEFPGLLLRGRMPGDRMRLPGGSKSLARLLIDRKVPREERDGLLVLASGSRILWAEGVGASSDIPGLAEQRAADPDPRFMERALELAADAAAAGELPVGAVVTKGGSVVGEAHNETERSGDPTAHAELLAMRRAAAELGDWRLSGCTLYVTLEPCPMCGGAAFISHLARIVFGAPNTRDGALGSVTDLGSAPWKRRIEVRAGLLAVEAGELLSQFFAARRS